MLRNFTGHAGRGVFAGILILLFALFIPVFSPEIGSGQGNSAPRPGLRTAGKPSPNAPDLDSIKNRSEPEPSKPEPVKAKRCRHWDQKCTKEKKETAKNSISSETGLLIAALDHRRSRIGAYLPLLADTLNSFTISERPNTGPDALPHAFASSLMSLMQYSTFETARVDQLNRTGRPGEDLYSGNFNFSIPIVSLPGRAGHDLNISLSYNSLVWTRNGNVMRFDMDYGTPSPGFRLGFPVFYGPYTNQVTQRVSYLLITPAGEAVELRKVSGYETYDAEDSSYTRLNIDPGTGNYVLTTADGTRYIYGSTLEIKDRNGNLITAAYNQYGQIETITDTLGRQVIFEYGGYYELLKVKQMRNGVMRVLAQFDYADHGLWFNFPGLFVDNVTNGQTIPVVYQVTLLDNSRYKFQYNSYGQVSKVERYAGLTFLRAWKQYNLPTWPAAQSDCPRFTKRTDWAFDWSGPSGVDTNFCYSDNNCLWDSAHTWGKVTAADGTAHNETYVSSGWQKGLPTQIETWAGGQKKKWTTLQWEQPCGNSQYQCNPRVAESNIYDDTNGDGTADNRRRTATAYTSFNLPLEVYEYAADASTLLRWTHTDYNLTSTYTSRRIIGLPSARLLYDGGSTLYSRIEYSYDQSGFLQSHIATPIRHDGANYGLGFLAGRGNLTSMRRYDITNNSSVEHKTGYYITGSPAFTRDPLNHDTSYSYNDSFSDGQNRNSFAYLTKLTDADNYFSTAQYEFHIGVATRTINPKNASVLREYDGYGRMWKITNEVNGAYTRYQFDVNAYYIASYTTIQEGQGEFYSITLFDGHDRVRGTSRDHPGSIGGYSSQWFFHDTLGRQVQQSNATETNANWTPAGDDAAGWAWSQQTYDWNSRPLVSTNPDGTTKTFSYTGCGCAGSDVTTITDEGTTITNSQGQPETKKRQQRTYQDVLGRTVKTQVLNWENGSPYSTTLIEYNVLDQVTVEKAFAGDAAIGASCPLGNCRQTELIYDGHARLQKRYLPVFQETSLAPPFSGNPSARSESYQYKNDDTLWKMTDPRGITATYTYNNRNLVTGIAYDATPSAPLPSPLPGLTTPSSSVSFDYDEAGNRLWMDDAAGRVDYLYDPLSRMYEETRLFDAGGITRSFTLKYEYNLAGELKKITDPWNASITYNRDKAGQETSLTGMGYKDVNQWTNRNVANFAANIKYRAWGGLKQYTSGTLSGNSSFAMGYDVRLRLTSYTGGGRTTLNQYHDDSLVKGVTDLHYGSNFNRSYEYDQAGRFVKAHAGGTAQTSSSPYSLAYNYDAWGNTTGRQGSHWSTTLPAFSTNYVNGRDVNMSYDQAGNIKGYTSTSDPYMHYDAAGKLFTQFESNGAPGIVRIRENFYDGDGAKILYKTSNGSVINGNYDHFCNYYLIRSSVLGGKVLAEFKDLTTLPANDPLKYSSMSYIYLNGVQVAFQQGAHQTTGDKHVVWTYHNPTVGNYFAEYQLNDSNQQQQNIPYGEMTFDPLGSYVGLTEQQPLNIPEPFTFSMGQFIDSNTGKCYADHVETSCTIVQSALNNGWGVQAPWGSSAIGMNRYSTSDTSFDFIVDWDNGFFGFVPTGMPLIPELINGQGMWVDPETAMSGGLQSIGRHIPKIDHLPTIGAEFPQSAYANTFYPIINDFVNNPECVQAYTDVGVDLIDLLTGEGKGIRIGPSHLINNRSKNEVKRLLGLTDAGYSHYQNAMNKGFNNGFTIQRSEHLVQNSIPTILITSDAMRKKDNDNHLAKTFAHELVHAGGISARTPFPDGYIETIIAVFTTGPANRPHDLDHIRGFDKLIKNCIRGN